MRATGISAIVGSKSSRRGTRPTTSWIPLAAAKARPLDEGLVHGVAAVQQEYVQRYGGSIAAEHGVGLLKKDYLHFSRSDLEVSIMRQIKAAFDPQGIMNPGKIFDL